MANETRRVMKLLRTATEREVIKLTLDIHADIVEETPVDTGWASNNWMLTIGSFVNDPFGTRENNNASQMAAGLSSIIGWTIPKGIIYITNNVPYITPLNEGHSKQAPSGYIDQIIQKRINEFNNKTMSRLT